MYSALEELERVREKTSRGFMLGFEGDLEASFRHHQLIDNVLFYKSALFVIYALIPLSGGIDLLVDIEVAKFIWGIRVYLFLPIFSIFILLAVYRKAQPYLEYLLLIGLMVLSALMMLIMVNIPGQHLYVYFSGYMIIVVVGLSASRLSFQNSIILAFASLIILLSGIAYSGSKVNPAVIQLYLFTGACVLGLLVSYDAEKRARINFLQQLILDEQKFHLERVNQELKREASTDALTGLANRRSFDFNIHREWQIAIRNSTPISLLMIDIDHFKVYNDTYGHQQGDRCLVMVAHSLKSVGKRPSDCIARYGGEEFVVLLPGIDLHSAEYIAENIRRSVERQQLSNVGVVSGLITISVGASASRPKLGESLQKLIKEADQKLYIAKQRGRNQVAC